jgi:putative NADH-flavin reductase
MRKGKIMKITVFGASGATGRHLVEQALAANHQVTAFVRSTFSLPLQHANLNAIAGELNQPDQVEHAIQSADVVISVLGCRKKGAKDVCTEGVRSILAAMATQQKRRLIVLSAYGAGETQSASLSARMIRWILAAKMHDKDLMEALVQAAEIDWTIVRPPALTNGPLNGQYQVGVGLRIGFFAHLARANLAHFMLREASDSRYFKQATIVRT